MIATPRKPNSIAGIKKFAKELKKGSKITHFQALNLAAQLSGFHNFNHAHSSLNPSASGMPHTHKHHVTISARWRDWEGKKGVSGWRIHLPNSSIKGDGVRVFLSGRDRPYRQDFHAPTKLLPQTVQSSGRSGMPATWSDDFQRSYPSRH